jgi:hypothetical protein
MDGQLTEDRVVQLRSQGRSYGAIAKLLGLRGGPDAYDTSCRALRGRPPAEQALLREQELHRLDTLTGGLRAQQHLSEEELADWLGALARLRQMAPAP